MGEVFEGQGKWEEKPYPFGKGCLETWETLRISLSGLPQEKKTCMCGS